MDSYPGRSIAGLVEREKKTGAVKAVDPAVAEKSGDGVEEAEAPGPPRKLRRRGLVR